jgi:hypothetical protein
LVTGVINGTNSLHLFPSSPKREPIQHSPPLVPSRDNLRLWGRYKGFERVEVRLKRETLLQLAPDLTNRSIRGYAIGDLGGNTPPFAAASV